MTTMTTASLLHEFASRLAARDGDYALEENSVGFSKPDTWAGHALADTPPEQWTPEVEAYAYSLLRKYADTQLHVDWSTVPVPELEGAHKDAAREQLYRGRGKALAAESLTVSLTADGLAQVEFRYDADLVASVKTIPGRKFDGQTKAWLIPATSFHALADWCAANDASVAPALDEIFTATADLPVPEPLPAKRVERHGNEFLIFFPYDPADVSRVKAMGARFSKVPEPHWTLAASKAAALMALDGYVMPDGLVEEAAAAQAEREHLLVASSALDGEPVEGYEGLYGFQAAGVRFALKTKRVLIADEMGLGKTVQAIATVGAANAYPAVVICPAVAKGVWLSEILRWSPGKTVSVINGKSQAKKTATVRLFGGDTVQVPVNDWTADVVVINYDIAGRWAEELLAREWRSVIMDESHYLKSAKAARTKTVAKVAKLPSVEYAIMLSGTPLTNRPIELASQLDILGALKTEWGSFMGFAKRHCAAWQDNWGWHFDGASNTEELHRRLRATVMVRRDKRDVLTELPPIQRTTLALPLADEKAYAKAAGETVAWLKEFGSSDHASTLVEINKLRQEASRQKLGAAVEVIQEFLDSSPTEKCIVFAWFIETQEALLQAFPGSARILGEDKAEERDTNVARFQNDPDCRVIVASIGAGGVGVTLTKATSIFFAETGWTPGSTDQAEARAYGRMSDAHGVNSYFLLGENTIDLAFASLQDSKREVVDKVTSGKSGASGGGILKALVQSLLKEEVI